MTHSLCALLHWLAAHESHGYAYVTDPELLSAEPEAKRLGLVECPNTGDVRDLFHLWLKEYGRGVVQSGLCAWR